MSIQSNLSSALTVKKCTVLGGAGYIFASGDTVDLVFHPDKLMVQADENMSAEIPYLELVDILISGPGTVVTGGGFMGGGFGVEGALEGMAAATILNMLSTRSKIHTFLTLVTHLGELHLHYGGMEPSALRISLSEVFTLLRRLDPTWLSNRLQKLEVLHAQKLLNDVEFDGLKQRLLFPPKPPAHPSKDAPSISVEVQKFMATAKQMAKLGFDEEGIASALEIRGVSKADALALAKSVKKG